MSECSSVIELSDDQSSHSIVENSRNYSMYSPKNKCSKRTSILKTGNEQSKKNLDYIKLENVNEILKKNKINSNPPTRKNSRYTKEDLALFSIKSA